MRKFAFAAALLLLAGCAGRMGGQVPTVQSSEVGATDCTAGQDASFLNQNNTGAVDTYVAHCSGNGY